MRPLAGLALCLVGTGCGSRGIPSGQEVVAAAERPAGVPTYRLRFGDEINIYFLTATDMNYGTPITPNGTVVLPMGGEVLAAGRTVKELSTSIEEHMAAYLLDPSTSVSLREIADVYVYVIGEVEKPGRYASQGGLTVTAALAQAGGVEASGRQSSVMVVRTSGVDEPIAFRVDVTKVLSGRDLLEDVALMPEDVVYVPKSVIGHVGQFVDLFFTKIAPAQLFYLRQWEINRRAGIKWVE